MHFTNFSMHRIHIVQIQVYFIALKQHLSHRMLEIKIFATLWKVNYVKWTDKHTHTQHTLYIYCIKTIQSAHQTSAMFCKVFFLLFAHLIYCMNELHFEIIALQFLCMFWVDVIIMCCINTDNNSVGYGDVDCTKKANRLRYLSKQIEINKWYGNSNVRRTRSVSNWDREK